MGSTNPDDIAGSCAGFSVRSGIPLDSLRSGDYGLPLTIASSERTGPVGETVATWQARPGNPFEATLTTDGRTFGFRAGDVGWFHVDAADARIVVPSDAHPVRREARLWGVPAALCLLARGDLSLHAAAIDVDGAAVLLAAPGGHGKTTLAGAMARAGYRLLSEDATACHWRDDAVVFPGPALIRLRPDMAARVAMPDGRVAIDDEERRYLLLEPASRGDGRPVPLRAIVLLRRGDGPIAVSRVAPERAIPDLWALNFRAPGEAGVAAAFDAVTLLVARVPVYDLVRPLTVDGLPAVIDTVAAIARGVAPGA